MLDKAKDLYENNNFIGKTLRNSRTKSVLPYINGHLLDVACGDNFLISLYKNGVGIDIKSFHKDTVVVNKMETLPFQDQTFDTITVLASLNYFDNPKACLLEMKRVLKEDGKIIVTMPNFWLITIWHIFRERSVYKSGFSRRELLDLFNNTRLEITFVKSFMYGVNYIYILKK